MIGVGGCVVFDEEVGGVYREGGVDVWDVVFSVYCVIYCVVV